jgi:hypothetical protein
VYCLGLLYLQLAHHVDVGGSVYLNEGFWFSLFKRAAAWDALPPSIQLYLSLKAAFKPGTDALLAIEQTYRCVLVRERSVRSGELMGPCARDRPMSQANRATAHPNNEVFDLSKESFGLRAFCPNGPATTSCSSSIVQNTGVRPFLRATLNPDLLQRQTPKQLLRLTAKLAAVKIPTVRYEPHTSPQPLEFKAKVLEIYGKELPHLQRKPATAATAPTDDKATASDKATADDGKATDGNKPTTGQDVDPASNTDGKGPLPKDKQPESDAPTKDKESTSNSEAQ